MSQLIQYGRHAKRRSYARIEEKLDLPNLIEIQTKSYEWFLQTGLIEMFKDISPVEDFTGNMSLEFVGYKLGEPSMMKKRQRTMMQHILHRCV